jgi:GntR family transcriptional regulator, gluconate operon transcriptional repressor
MMRVNENGWTSRPQHNQVWEAVLSNLRLAIIRGQLPAGTHLLEAQLAEKLRVSRGPVREALLRLEQEGLLINQPYRGKFVANITPQMIQEIYSLRRVLECFAAELAVNKLELGDLERLGALFERMMLAVNAGHFEEFADIDLEFHRLFVVAAGHTRLLQMWETLTDVNHAFIVVNASLDQENYRMIAQGHQAILQAFAQHNVEEVKATLNFHLEEAERRLRATMREPGAGVLSNQAET